MALDANDLMMLRGMGSKDTLTPYEQVKLDYMSNRNHTSGIGVAGLVLGTVGTAIGVGAWLFGGMYGNAKANQAKEVANGAKELAAARIESTQRQLDQLTTLLASERQERLQGDYTITQTVNDTVSSAQQGTLTAMQQAELNSAQQVMLGLQTGKYSENPQRVALYQDARPCPCPAGGCGFNG